jgi:signal transduction histidine kinase
MNGSLAVMMGWLVTCESYPLALDSLHRECRRYNVFHKYHRKAGDIDNVFFMVLGRIDQAVQFSIQDSGKGIPPEHLQHIFDRFYRVDKSRPRRSGGGSGIGLTIARALIEAQGGRIWAEYLGEGQGSKFNFTLPVA